MKYNTIVIMHKEGKKIFIMLKEGYELSYNNIVDIEIYENKYCDAKDRCCEVAEWQ